MRADPNECGAICGSDFRDAGLIGISEAAYNSPAEWGKRRMLVSRLKKISKNENLSCLSRDKIQASTDFMRSQCVGARAAAGVVAIGLSCEGGRVMGED